MALWFADNWVAVVVPLLAFGATAAAGLWLRRYFVRFIANRSDSSAKGRISQVVVRAVRRPFLTWFLLLGIFIAVEASMLPDNAKLIAAKIVTSFFIMSLAWAAIALSEEFIEVYLPRMKLPRSTVDLALSFVIITFLVASVLAALDIWGIPTTPFLIIVAVVILIGILASRNVAPNVFAAIHMWNTEHVKAGDYIRLETGEEGYVTEINWNSTHIKTLSETKVVIPNGRLIQSKFVNYGQPEKVTRELFTFNGKAVSRELPLLNPGQSKEISIEAGAVHFDTDNKSVLSDREKEISRLISEGVSNREIGEKLFIAENTVKVHVKNILKKLELRNRQQLAAYTALQHWAITGEAKSPEQH